MTYLQRINYLNKKIERKQMEIEEFEYLKSWYNKKVIADCESRKHRFCITKNCKYYQRGQCFINKIPENNECNFYDV